VKPNCFARIVIDDLSDIDILEALTHLDPDRVKITIEAGELKRLEGYVDNHDKHGLPQSDIIYTGFGGLTSG